MARELKEYIVVVKHAGYIDEITRELADWGITIDCYYKNVFPGFRAKLGVLISNWIKDDPRIDSIEEVSDIHQSTVQPIDKPGVGPWHLDRIDQTDLPLSGNYTFSFDGQGLKAYVIDSGFQFNHDDFEGRISAVDEVGEPGKAFDPFTDARLVTNPEDGDAIKAVRGFDENGHGTHVAGILGSKTYGVAKAVTLKTAKVFGISTVTTSGMIIDGIDAVLEDYNMTGMPLSVANMSLGGQVPTTIKFITGVSSPTFVSGQTIIIDGVTVTLSGTTINDVVNAITAAAIPNVTATKTLTALTITKDPGLLFLEEGNGTALADLGFVEGVPSSTMTTLERAIDSMVQAGITVFTAAGNQGIDAHLITPARMPQVITTGASDKDDNVANFSNFGDSEDTITPPEFQDPNLFDFGLATATNTGSAVDLYAPGVGILSTWVNTQSNKDGQGKNRVNILSGTSMASPVVAGIGITVLHAHSFLTPRQVADKIKAEASVGKLVDLPIGSNDRLAFSIFTDNFVSWNTPEGSLGSFNEGFFVGINLSVISTLNQTVSFDLINGTLPTGLTLSSSGTISGVPSQVTTDTTFNFVIRALDGVSTGATATASLVANTVSSIILAEADGGSGYSDTPSITIVGDGTGATAEAVISGGSVTSINVTNVGSGYTTATVVIELPGVRSFSIEILDAIRPLQWNSPTDLGEINEGEPIDIQFSALSNNGVLPENINYTVVNGPLPHSWSLALDGKLTGFAPATLNQDLETGFTLLADDGIAQTDRSFGITIKKLQQQEPPTQPEWQTPSGIIGTVVSGDAFSGNVLAIDQDAAPLPLTYNLTLTTGDGSTFGPFGELPPSLSLDQNTGAISGTLDPIALDTLFEFGVFVTDGANVVGRLFGIQALAEQPNQIPVWVTPFGQLGDMSANQAVLFQLDGNDPDSGPNPLSFILVAGNLPPGLSLNSSTGAISGTINDVDEAERFVFIIRLSDGPSFVDRTFSINVKKVNQAPFWNTAQGELGPFDEGQSVNFELDTDDIHSDILTHTLIAGALPPGLVMSPAGRISGTFFELAPAKAVANIVSDELDSVVVLVGGSGYKDIPTITISGDGTGATAEAVLINDRVTEINVTSAGTGYTTATAEIEFLQSVTFDFTLKVDDILSNLAGEDLFADRDFSITVIDGALNVNQLPIWVTPPGALLDATETLSYSTTLEAIDPDNGPNPLTFEIASGVLPVGLILNSNTGEISGTAPADGDNVDQTFSFVLKVSDNNGITSVQQSFSIKVVDLNLPPVWISSGLLGVFNEASAVDIMLQATDPEMDTITFAVQSGNFPPGLILNKFNGSISGLAPAVATDNTFNFVIRATDEFDNFTDQAFSITINNVPNQAPIWNTAAGLLGSFNEGSVLNISLAVTDPDDGPGPLRFDLVTGALPIGLALNNDTGQISGTASAVASDTTFNFEISVTDFADSVLRAFSIEILDVPIFVGTSSTLFASISGPLRIAINEWNTDSLIPDALLFEPANPLFGRVTESKVFVAGKLRTIDPDTIQALFDTHHRAFNGLVGALKFAVVRDSVTSQILHEVIYLPIIDSQLGSFFTIDSAVDQSTITSRNFDHLRVELLEGIEPDGDLAANLPVNLGILNDETLPPWMTSEQDAGIPESILGYVPAIELAYVQPNTAGSILLGVNQTQSVIPTPVVFETTFDLNELSGTALDPTVNIGDQILINGQVVVTFTGTDVFTVKNDIQQALNAAGIINIGVGVADSFEFIPSILPGPSLIQTFGKVIRFNFDSSFITLQNLTGTPLTALGLVDGLNVQTTFNGGISTFDKNVVFEDQSIGNAGLGLRFVGSEITFDRYRVDTSIGNQFQLKWFSDREETHWDNNGNEVHNQITPYFITTGGTLKVVDVIDPASDIQIQAATSNPNQILSYNIIFGSIPSGFILNITSGEITGTATEIGNFIFVVRAEDQQRNFVDRNFTIEVVAAVETLFDGDTTTFNGDTTTFDEVL